MRQPTARENLVLAEVMRFLTSRSVQDRRPDTSVLLVHVKWLRCGCLRVSAVARQLPGVWHTEEGDRTHASASSSRVVTLVPSGKGSAECIVVRVVESAAPASSPPAWPMELGCDCVVAAFVALDAGEVTILAAPACSFGGRMRSRMHNPPVSAALRSGLDVHGVSIVIHATQLSVAGHSMSLNNTIWTAALPVQLGRHAPGGRALARTLPPSRHTSRPLSKARSKDADGKWSR